MQHCCGLVYFDGHSIVIIWPLASGSCCFSCTLRPVPHFHLATKAFPHPGAGSPILVTSIRKEHVSFFEAQACVMAWVTLPAVALVPQFNP